MSFPDFLKAQFTDAIDNYKKHFGRTFGVAISFTIICFIGSAILFRFSDFDKEVTTKQISLLSYFFNRYSKFKTYSLVDLTKTMFIFFIAVFSVGMSRITRNETEVKELSFIHLSRVITGRDVIILSSMLVLTSILDFVLVKFQSFLLFNFQMINLLLYLSNTIYHIRIYLPLILFSLTILYLTKEQVSKLSSKRILFLYISLWICNEMAYEFFGWVRIHVFELILLPFRDSENSYLIESILGIPLVALLFLGYYSAMTTSLRLTESKSLPVSQEGS